MLNVKEVSTLLAVPEKTVYRWIRKNEIPVNKIGGAYRFNRVELLEWATARSIPVAPGIFDESAGTPSLTEALKAGGIYYRVAGGDREGAIRAVVDIMHLPDDVDKELLTDALIARENLGTTAIGDGIAIPHIRNPLIFHVSRPFMALCFLERPVDFGAVDRKPVDTVFTIITPSVRAHLSVLSRLSYALHRPDIRNVFRSASAREEIIAALSALEVSLPESGGKGAGA